MWICVVPYFAVLVGQAKRMEQGAGGMERRGDSRRRQGFGGQA